MKQFLESLVKSIVENPDAVTVTETQEEQDRQLLTITVDQEDMGRVIGKSGKVINAIRTIMRVVAIRQGVKVRVDIHDEQGGPAASSAREDSPAAPETSDETEAPEAVADSEETEAELTPAAPIELDDETPSAADIVQAPQEEAKAK